MSRCVINGRSGKGESLKIKNKNKMICNFGLVFNIQILKTARVLQTNGLEQLFQFEQLYYVN